RQGKGYEAGNPPAPFSGWIGRRNEGAVAIALPDGKTGGAGGLEAISGLFEIAALFDAPVTLEPGQSHTFTRWYAVGPDMATITDAWLTAGEVGADPVGGAVPAPDGPVEGARVAILADGAPYTVAFTDADGAFEALVPAGADVTFLAEG